jgi:deoxycytidine triphosphate deaminase
MLSDKDIIKVIESGQLSVNPFNIKQLRPAGITLYLGKEI